MTQVERTGLARRMDNYTVMHDYSGYIVGK